MAFTAIPKLNNSANSSPEEAKDFASKMLGAKLITKQTGAAGRICNTVRHVHFACRARE